jgi:YD repeat-containing protein
LKRRSLLLFLHSGLNFRIHVANRSCTRTIGNKFKVRLKLADRALSIALLHGNVGHLNVSRGDIGEITGITDNVDNVRSVDYAYDYLARLKTAGTTGSGSYPQWGLSFTYDQHGNRTAQGITAGCAAR